MMIAILQSALIFMMVDWMQVQPLPLPFNIWTWDRFDDLSFMEGQQGKIAALIATFRVSASGRVITELRHHDFLRPHSVSLITVFRLEIAPTTIVRDESINQIVASIQGLSSRGEEIQIDFDATKSQRPLYKKLLLKLRDSTDKRLSMTALASWCTHDPWLDSLPIEYAVPMMYTLGRDQLQMHHYLRANKHWGVRACKGYVGLSLNDLSLLENPSIMSTHKVFLFNNHAWSQEDFKRIQKKVKS
ncbi:MAG: hypothetical protein K2X53_03795 [Alphaproteobacteria bacterium]|nr:hypothetical protein [Alphaproteobacteria bacterium]